MIRLAARFGPVLAGRPQAFVVRQEIESETRAGNEVVVDLEGVITMSPSFADELFGKLATEVRSGQVRFEHLSGHLASVAQTAAAGRGSAPLS
jgi:anti-anti-sigma regulatory factor